MQDMSKKLYLIIGLFSISLTSLAGVDIVECKDSQGGRGFYKICPPGFEQINKKRVQTGASKTSSANQDISATLYRIPECDACDEVKEFLNARGISVTSKNVDKNVALQSELLEFSSELTVPVTIIGEEMISGYNRTKLLSVLKAAGYTEDDTDS